MSIECPIECDDFVELSEDLIVSPGTEFCCECGCLIPCGKPHYHVRQWQLNEWGDEGERGQRRCCEECGDLALSYLELGFCWTFGDLLVDIAELNDGK